MKLRNKLTVLVLALAILNLIGVQAQAQKKVTLNVRVQTYGCHATSGSDTADLGDVYVNTGYQQLDAFLLDDINSLNIGFGVTVPLYFTNTGTANAFFVPLKFPDLIQAEGGNPLMDLTGSVFVDAALLKKEYEDGKGNAMSIPAILAHEYAHAMQRRNGFPYKGKWAELHADYMAGFYIGMRQLFRLQDANRAWVSIASKGDWEFFSPEHHGTPAERAEAFATGYNLVGLAHVNNAGPAYNAGVQFVVARGAR